MNESFEKFSFYITRIYQEIQQLKIREMKKYGLKGSHVMCLYELYSHPEGITSSALAAACGINKAAVSRCLAVLEEKAFITVEAPPGQRRYRTPILLTETGKAIAAALNRSIEASVMFSNTQISAADQEVFFRSLEKITENLKKYREGENK